MRRWGGGVLGWVVAFLLGCGLAWSAGYTTLSRPEVAEGSRAPVLYTVTRGTLQRAVSFTAEASWTSTPAASNSASGTVTTVSVRPGQAIDAGDVLYTADLQPVVAAQGSVPSFRDLSIGATGADVAQLERFLAGTVDFAGTVDEEFTELTAVAVEAWQTQLGVQATGVVQRGDLLFLPRLPERVVLNEQIEIGAELGPGSAAVETLSKSPEFTVTLGEGQSDLVPLDGDVRVHRGEVTWRGVIASATQTPLGELQLELQGKQGRPLCHPECSQLPVNRPTLMRAELIVVPATTGPIVPAAAVRTTPAGQTVVVGADGGQLPVKVLAEAYGQAVVSGLETGDRIRLYGESAQSVDTAP